MYAIVDIETTGGNAGTGSITEIAIIISEGKEIIHRYSTLVNPMQPIPIFIEKLTGISDELVKDAPVFSQVAKEVFELLQDKIFVAHNVNFDYSFISHQLAQHGFKLQSRKLCTVRLSRKIFQDQPKYSLGQLCRSLGIEIKERHRAMGDAEATAVLFHRLLENDTIGHVKSMLKKGSGDSYLPMHLSEKDLNDMPNKPGIYYFHDKKGKIIYVGKAKKLKKRVTSHFANNNVSMRKQALLRLVSRVSYKECGNELMMSVMESIEIKRLWPEFNRAQKKFENRFGICSYTDMKGIVRLGLVKKKKQIPTHSTFAMLMDGRSMLHRLARTHNLCPKMCFIQDENVHCVGIEESYCDGICEQKESIESYNNKVANAIEELINYAPVVAVFGPGRTINESSCVMIGRNDFLATGYIEGDYRSMNKKALETQLEPAASNEYIRSLVLNHASSNPEYALWL
ncbi:MAG: exonuclease domain-containing protein [bacterium]|jgi:DNA polymerase-3 subunit epsilon